MSQFTDSYQDQLARKRKIGAVIAALVVAAAAAIVIIFVAWPAPAPPKGAELTLEPIANKVFEMGCPQGWRNRASDGTLSTGTCMKPGGGTSCITVSEPLPKRLSPAAYWQNAQRLVGRARSAKAFSIDGRPLHRVIASRSMSPTLMYIYTVDQTAVVMSCSSNLKDFDGLIPTFDTIGQSIVPKG